MADKMTDLTESEKKLHEYVLAGKFEEVKQTLNEAGVRVDCQDEHGMTPLMQAAFKGNFPMCELFLASGANVNSNNHDSGYTALMFAGLSGNVDVTRLMLSAGAKPHVANNMGRNAAQMAAFVSQHQCVSLINNFFSQEDLDYYTQPRALETEAKLPAELSSVLHKFILISNLCPVKLAIYLSDHPELLESYEKVYRLLDHLCEKVMKQRETNEVLGLKFHYHAHVVKQCGRVWAENKSLDKYIKNLLRGRESDGFPLGQEQFIRSSLKDFPYMENQLIQQLCRTLAPVKVGNEPTALNVLTNSINGQRMASEDDNQCHSCMDFFSTKKCSACNMVTYCNQRCQKYHWFQHKKYCKTLAAEYKRLQKLKEEEKKKEQEQKQENKENDVHDKPEDQSTNMPAPLEKKAEDLRISENGENEKTES